MNKKLIDQVVRIFEDKVHFGLNKVKTRAEVNKTKKKLYKQKGTGGARHGAKSAPIFVGGGKAHGPKGVKRELKLSKKMAKKALKIVLAEKIKAKKIYYLSNLNGIKKTKDAQKMLKEMKLAGKVMIVLSIENKKYVKFFRNIENIRVLTFDNLNVLDLVRYQNILMEKKFK